MKISVPLLLVIVLWSGAGTAGDAKYARPQLLLEPGDFLGHAVEQTGPFLQRGTAVCHAATFSEQGFKYHPWVRFRREWRRG